MLVIRGANSDLLSTATVAAMQNRPGGLEVVEVADEGHAPRLTEPELITQIAAFIAKCDETKRDETKYGGDEEYDGDKPDGVAVGEPSTQS